MNNELKQNFIKLMFNSSDLLRDHRNQSYVTLAYQINFTKLHTHVDTTVDTDSLQICCAY